MRKEEWQQEICRAAKTEDINQVAKTIDGVTLPLLGDVAVKPTPRFISAHATELTPAAAAAPALSNKTTPAEELADVFAALTSKSETIRLKVNPHLFISIAKLRAARWLAAALELEIKIHAVAPEAETGCRGRGLESSLSWFGFVL